MTGPPGEDGLSGRDGFDGPKGDRGENGLLGEGHSNGLPAQMLKIAAHSSNL
jgi:hypothetical protein